MQGKKTTRDNPMPRAMCYRCYRPELTCVCASITQVDNKTPVFLLQHPRERHHPIGTERFVRLGLRRSYVEVCSPREQARLSERLPPDTALLFPSKRAEDLATIPAADRPANLLVIDGTWNHTLTMVREWRWLQQMRHVRIAPRAPSQYRLRREPTVECVSTIEAVVDALKLLEPETVGLNHLVGAFTRMIDTQIELKGRRAHVPRTRRPRRLRHNTPGALRCERARLVVCYGEFLPRDSENPPYLLHWTAVRAATNDLFSCLIRPPKHASWTRNLIHLGLTQEQLALGSSREEFERQWRTFCTADDVVTAWNQSNLSLLTFPEPRQRVELKRVYCNLMLVLG
ncbi:tRNA-uridine aminocarboxypropyltransferase [Myxococcota bacterium]